MRISREKLVDLARAEAERRAAADLQILSGYLIGSVASGDPLLGGTADIDLVLIHQGAPALAREAVGLSEDVHLDIAHHALEQYAHPPSLRVDPWLGPALSEPVFLHDPAHVFERIQAGARGQFHRPDHALARARAALQRARALLAPTQVREFAVGEYLQAVLEGANAAAGLAGPPAAGRRLSSVLEQRALALGRPEIAEGFGRLLGAEHLSGWDLPEVLSAWGRTWDAAFAVGEQNGFIPARRSYYLTGFQVLAESERPDGLLWPLLRTWDRSLRALGRHAGPELRTAWEAFLDTLHLSPQFARVRRDELEAYLDHVEAILETWGEQHGA